MGHIAVLRRPFVALALVASVLGVATPAGADPATPQLQPGFSVEQVFGNGLLTPVAMRFAPNGKVFVAEKAGKVKVFDSVNSTSPRLVADLSNVVHSPADRGLLGLAVDPQYPARPYIWVAYSYNAPPGETAPFYPAQSCPTPPGPNTDGCVIQNRLSRLTLDANDQMVSEQVLITDWCQQFSSHSIGDLRFGQDGALYVSAGDGASFDYIDYGQAPTGNGPITPSYTPANPCNDPPGAVGTPLSATNSQGGALRAQSFRRAPGLPVSLDGAILRLDPDTGAAMADNPAANDANLNRRRIIGYGLRNPYRITMRPGTNELWSTNVGANTTEWVNRIIDPKASVKNFGWPCYEGSQVNWGFQALGNATCNSVYAQGITTPYYQYNHTGAGSQIGTGFEGVNGTACNQGSGALTGAAFYNGGLFGNAQPTSNYPAAYDGALFFTDFTRRCIYAMQTAADGLPDPNKIVVVGAEVTGTTDGGVVALEAGPDGNIWFIDIANSAIKRIKYTADNPPVAVMGTNPNPPTVAPGGTVEFNSTGSNDPAGGAITYSWDLDGDGEFDDATTATTSYTYPTPGDVMVKLRVTNSSGVSTTTEKMVHVAASTVVIDTPTAATTWTVGSTVNVSGHATDASGNPLPASDLTWDIQIHHCPNFTCHTHALQTIPGVATAQFTAPDHEYPSALVVKLSANNGGVVDSQSIEIQPVTTTLTVNTNPPGLNVAVNADAGPSPRTRTVIQGSQNSVSAPDQFFGGQPYEFTGWSDGGAQSHNVTVNAPTTLTANFAINTSGTLPPPEGGGWQLNGTSALTSDGVQLTPADPNIAGSVFYPVPVPSGDLTADFDFNISGGTGADGMAFLLADPTTQPTALGGTGGLLGFGGIAGTAVAFDTYQNTGEPSGNFVGIATGLGGAGLTYSATNTAVPPLQGATHHATVTTTGGRLKVQVDGIQYLDVALALPPTVMLGFSAGTGGLSNNHTVSNVEIDDTTEGSGTPVLSVAPNPIAFGNVTVGTTATLPVTIANTGTAPLTIGTITAPSAPFAATGMPANGTAIAPGASVNASVTFTPTAAGGSNSALTVPSDGGTITIPTSGNGIPGGGTVIPPPASGGWQLNGSAALTTGGVKLTPAAETLAGSAFYSLPVDSGDLTADFDFNISGGNGADGMTFVLAAPTTAPTALGGTGGLLGFGGITGTAVAFDTYQGATDPSGNFVGITNGAIGSALGYSLTNVAVPPLQGVTHHATITTTGGHLKVKVDGVQYLDQAITLPPTVMVGFTAATGGLTNNHTVTNIAIETATSAGTPVLSVTPDPVAFGDVTVGATGTVPVVIANTGTAPLTIGTATAPSAPFGATGLPADGATIAPGTSVNASLTYSPTAAGASNSTLTVTSDGGNATVPTTGNGVTAGPAICPPDDTHEPNDDTAAATPLGRNTPVEGTACGSNHDFFRIRAAAAGTVDATLAFQNASGNLDLNLRDAAGTVVASSTGTGDTETISYAAPAAGTYFLEVFAVGSGTNNTYTLTANAPHGTVAADYDGDGKADVTVFRPASNEWFSQPSFSTGWGQAGDVPVSGDFNGDGIADAAVFRPSDQSWYVQPNNGWGGLSTQWGAAGDIPVPADYNGDGITDIAVYRPSDQTWYVQPSASFPAGLSTQWGVTGDIPVPADYNGDGIADIAVYRPSDQTWYAQPNNGWGGLATQWGTTGDQAVPADYNGDGIADIAVYRPSDQTWYAQPNNGWGGLATQWGATGDVPVVIPFATHQLY